ncbi:MAG: D-2-hydroxyacid dehydrogenase [Christensenellaceae bacterium]|jgi:phosphoglycerate dehydrogenase-like enzyme|nr:D-2-hydroxyacid dehydrogenase [Christensenellaceae bacterium]
MLKAAVLQRVTDAQKEMLQKENPTVEFVFQPELTEENIGEFDAILGNTKPALLKHAKKLKFIQLGSAGVDGYTAEGVFGNPDTILCNASGAYGLAISECLVAMHLAVQKHLHFYRDNMKAHAWKDHGMVQSVMDSTVLVVGTGDIGNQYARRVKAMGAKLYGVRRTGEQMPELYEKVYTVEQIDEILPQADAVALCLPGTEKTRGLFSKERLHKMKKGAILLNIGRGSAIDSEGLYDVLTSGHLLGAAIDVTDPEPLPAESPLWDVENLLITPHVTGGGHLLATTESIVRIGCENLKLVVAGKRPPRVVNLKEGY